MPECPAGPDPADVVESHVVLDAVANGLCSLSEAERQAILAPLVDQGASQGPDGGQVKMRRYRARQHLEDLVERQGVSARGRHR